MKELDELRDRYHKGTRDLLEPQQSLLVLEALAAGQERLRARVEWLVKLVAALERDCIRAGPTESRVTLSETATTCASPAPAEPSEEDVEWLSDVYQGASLHRSTRAREALRALISRGWTPPRKP